ncbi:MAG TPA: tRNA (adenosine(37)-N6)-threonylcarbamoyltransferase complex ATPase subunit type 1 TsaE, partial [Candidatus Paceibacterota bacterium]
MKIQVQNGEELRRVAAEIVLNVTPRNVATTIALSGELGAGKTTFVQEIARALGVSETVSSPTFVIEKIYPIRDAARSNGAGDMNVHFKQLIHID